MKIEILFPEFCNLFGDISNMKYLKMCLPNAQYIETAIDEEPTFVKEDVNLIYMGPMTEKTQEKVIEKLKPYKERIEELIKKDVVFLFTGNSIEILGEYIENEDGSKIYGLGIFNVYAKRDMMNRFNSLYIGSFGDMKIVGYKSQFTHSYWEDGAEVEGLFMTERGPGLNPDIEEEGIRKNNFMASYIIGPLLVLNPPFAKYILKTCGIETPLAFEKEAMDAYEARVAEYSEPDRGFYY